MSDVVNFKCPACGAPISYKGESGGLACDYCGSSFDMEQVKAAEAAEKVSAESSDMTWTEPDQELITDEDGKIEGFLCPSCGAEIIADESLGATECPYCGNKAVVPHAFDGMYRPDVMIPFKLNKERAQAAMKNFYKGKKLLPNGFADGNRLKEIQGVYVPFWLMSCEAEGNASFEGIKTETRESGKKRYIKEKHYLIHRRGKMQFNRIPADGSKAMDDEYMDGLEPYDYSGLVQYDDAYFSGYLANRYDVSAEEVQNRINVRVENSVTSELMRTATGYDSVNVKDSALRYNSNKTEYAMLPVWMLTTKFQNEKYSFAMNGQTGKISGKLPIDMGKYWKYLILALLICFIVGQVLIGFFAGSDGFSMLTELVVFAVSAFVGWAYAGSLKKAMSTAETATEAGKYLDTKTFKVMERSDTFMYEKNRVEDISDGK
ncbi:replication restart DNA helicase PriA [Lachnospiraceae bacterium]|nr:replication restart DNA helicase PriA [Lachnospiraceae bacterium]